MPEGNLARLEAVVYLSVAPKSNALYTAYGDVQQDVEQTAADAVPLHLRNAPTALMKGLGYGQGYQYAHDLDAKVADMQCLPDNLRDRVYYRPTNEGIEKRIRERIEEIKRHVRGPVKAALRNQRKNRSIRARHPIWHQQTFGQAAFNKKDGFSWRQFPVLPATRFFLFALVAWATPRRRRGPG